MGNPAGTKFNTGSEKSAMTSPLTSRTEIMSILENRGYRSTAPRRAIVELMEGKKEGFTAEEISIELPQVGRATVFRTVKLLLNAGVLCRLNMLDGAPRYTISSVEHHHHTICVQCGSVGEFRATIIENLMRAVSEQIPGEIVGHRFEFFVNCEICVVAK